MHKLKICRMQKKYADALSRILNKIKIWDGVARYEKENIYFT